MGRLLLVLGGARSGKSSYAEQVAAEVGGDSVLYVATAQAFDAEMQARIDQHRAERPARWRTLESPTGVGDAILAAQDAERLILLDCLTVLVSNLLLGFEDPFADEATAAVQAEIDGLLRCVERLDAHFVVVSNEVGMGLVPAYPLGRAYRDLLGRANQQLAARADRVVFLVAGLPMVVKATDSGSGFSHG